MPLFKKEPIPDFCIVFCSFGTFIIAEFGEVVKIFA